MGPVRSEAFTEHLLAVYGGLAGLQWAWVGSPVGGARFQGRVCTRPPTPSGCGGISERFLRLACLRLEQPSGVQASCRPETGSGPRYWRQSSSLRVKLDSGCSANCSPDGRGSGRFPGDPAWELGPRAGGSPPPPSSPGLPGHPALSGWTLSWGDPAVEAVLRLGAAWPR